jgi:hypothetical protein
MKSNDDRKIVRFEKTGLGTIHDDVERTALRPGDKILITRIRLRNSAKYGMYAVLDGLGEDDIEVNKYTTSAVIIEQLQSLIEMFKSNEEGYIESWVRAQVEERESSTGRRYLTLA